VASDAPNPTGDSAERQETIVKDSDLDQAKGRIKQAAGDLTGDDQLRREGKTDEAAGKAKDGLDKITDKLRDAVDDVKDRVQRSDR
jgi:uncharacterized protein YjbJ (UPF0337 family)